MWNLSEAGGSHLSQFFHLRAAEKGLGRAGKPSRVSWGLHSGHHFLTRPVERPCEDPGADPEVWGAGTQVRLNLGSAGLRRPRDSKGLGTHAPPSPGPAPTPPFSTLANPPTPHLLPGPLPLNPAHAPPPPLRSPFPLSGLQRSPPGPRAPPPLPHLRLPPSLLSPPPLPLSVAPDRPTGGRSLGAWHLRARVSSPDAEKAVPSTDRCARGWGDGGPRREEGGVLREGGRVWLAEEGKWDPELAAQNHSCLDRLATGPGRPYVPPPPWRRRELWLGAGVSLSVPIVKSGVPLTLPVSRGGGSPSHPGQGVTCRRRGSCLPWTSLRTTHPPQALSSSFQPSTWVSVQDRCHRQGGLAGHGCFAFLPKEA